MSFSKIASALAASALLVTPIAAQAGTRASGSSIYPAAVYSANRASAKVAADNSLAPLLLLAVIVGSVAATAVVVNEIAKTPGD
ncbi:hypothetical protein IP81_00295 [Novosphingobium sp. AAP83]|uniref:hypothetical protein n=1 Tax=Novosphingobium sp. AAP83 TaxID=1523425 RepID=UPI0006B8C863|nr:hypothetical protein [Novosphingobium sp. AAP83]KPF93961.1 hypothetical protein IP81_00295 [Novosphingobium sp. AAP83]